MAPPEGLTATIELDASTWENGAQCCLRGSHKLGLLPHTQSGIPGFSRTLADPIDTEIYREVALCLQRGDVAFHHIRAVHYSGANESPNSRRQVGIPTTPPAQNETKKPSRNTRRISMPFTRHWKTWIDKHP
jgi:ectoine hydroxylase-related dioxygenase (phytanoyl-CoA dioxygenase family)